MILSQMSVMSLAACVAAATWMLAAPAGARGAIKTQTIAYQDGETKLQGFLAYDDSTSKARPGVLVIPEWWGVTDYTRHRAQMLAELGYVAFVADMYGEGKSTNDAKEAGNWATAVSHDKAVLRRRAQAGLNVLASQAMADKTHLAAIGYCFGGTAVLELARVGDDLTAAGTTLAGVASFHGGLGSFKDADFSKMKAKALVLNGAADTFVPPQQVQDCTEAMTKGGVDFQVVNYSHAVHAFTNPDADSHHIPNIAYNEAADKRSWQAMKDFFGEIFGSGA